MRRALLTAILVPLFPVPATSFAQTQMPSQADNVRASHDGQLAEAEVRQSVVAPSPSTRSPSLPPSVGRAPRNARQPHGIASGRPDARARREQRPAPYFWLGRDA
jgi:hypothetical protein